MNIKIKLSIFFLFFSILILFFTTFLIDYILKFVFPYNLIVMTPIAIVMSFGAVYIVARELKQKISAISAAMEAISSGDFTRELDSSIEKEFVGITQLVNDIRETLKSYLVSASDKSALEDKLITVLDVVSMAAEGNFTKKAPVTPDMIGTISDAFNLMSDGLVTLINEVKSTALEVGKQSQIITSTLNNISKEINTQKLGIDRGVKTVGSALVTFQAVAEKALDSAIATDIAFQSSQSGRHSINKSVQSMQIVRNTTATIARKMKSLSERILEIGKMMEIITEVASRTNILSLNASIEASRAGEQGRGFLNIATEIRKLSEKTSNSAKEIENIIRSIQMEASEVSLAIERGTQQVEVVAEATNVTETSFRQVEDAVSVANNAMTDIANATKAQVVETAKLNKVMNKVSQIARRTVEQTSEIVSLVEGLNDNAKNLLTSMGRFKTSETDTDASMTPALEAVTMPVERKKPLSPVQQINVVSPVRPAIDETELASTDDIDSQIFGEHTQRVLQGIEGSNGDGAFMDDPDSIFNQINEEDYNRPKKK
jgi:twitching motility protein PilJ